MNLMETGCELAEENVQWRAVVLRCRTSGFCYQGVSYASPYGSSFQIIIKIVIFQLLVNFVEFNEKFELIN